MKTSTLIVSSFITFLFCLLPIYASAQQGEVEQLRQLLQNTTPQQRARFEDHWMKRDLSLSGDQTKQVEKINLRTAKRMQSIFDSDGARFRKFREIMQARSQKDRDLQNVLTGAQFTKYNAKKEDMWQKMHNLR